jgi:hypothetical protein
MRSSWANVLELLLRLDKLELLPPGLEALVDADVWGVGATAGGVSGAAGGARGSNSSGAKPAAPAAAAAAAAPAAAAADAGSGGQGQQQQQPSAAAAAKATRPLRSARQRRAAAGGGGGGGSNARGARGVGVGVGGAFLRSVTQLIALQEPEYEAKYASQVGGSPGAEGLPVHGCGASGGWLPLTRGVMRCEVV